MIFLTNTSKTPNIERWVRQASNFARVYVEYRDRPATVEEIRRDPDDLDKYSPLPHLGSLFCEECRDLSKFWDEFRRLKNLEYLQDRG